MHRVRRRTPAALPPERFGPVSGLVGSGGHQGRRTGASPSRTGGSSGLGMRLLHLPLRGQHRPCDGFAHLFPDYPVGWKALGHLKRVPFLGRATHHTRVTTCALHHPMSCELILGGARSGKSRLAEARAAADGRPVTVIATAEALDAEMAVRIARHRADRPAGWRTLEATRGLATILEREARGDLCILVDCLTLWLANLMDGAENLPEPHGLAHLPALAAERDALLATLPALPGRILLVANEVGLGLVPESPLGRLFRDEAGRLNQQVAALARRVTFVAAGLPLELKGAP